MEKMKTIKFLPVILVIMTAIISCSKDAGSDPEGIIMKDAYVLNNDSRPISAGLITPVILAVDKPRGGNVSCTDVEQAFETEFDLCGDKLNFGNYDLDSEMEFDGSFPEWLEVTVTNGTYVSFSVNNSGETCYKVGAVIVKGGNSANVYYYENGTNGDSGLASPVNSSSLPAGLSNLTFCFYECEAPPELVVAFKSLTSGPAYFVTTGAYLNSAPASYPLVIGASYPIYYEGNEVASMIVGHLTITDSNADGYWEITADNFIMPAVQYIRPYLYVGTAEGYLNLTYTNYPYPDPKVTISPVNTWTFILPYQL